MTTIVLQRNNAMGKFNHYLLDKNNKIILSLIFLFISFVISYVFFLFMSVSYTYAVDQDSYHLNNLIAENIQAESTLFEKEKEKKVELLNNTLVKLDNIDYVKSTEILVANVTR